MAWPAQRAFIRRVNLKLRRRLMLIETGREGLWDPVGDCILDALKCAYVDLAHIFVFVAFA